MIDNISRLGERVFPERQILIHSRGKITHLTLPSLLQAGVVAISLAGAASFGISALSPHGEDAAAITQLKQQLAEAKQAADAAGARLQQLDTQRQARGEAADATEAAAAVDVATLTDRVKQLEGNLDQATQKTAETKSLYDRAAAQLEKLAGEQKRMKADQEKLAAEKGKLQTKVGELEDEKDKAERGIAGEREKLRQKVAELELKLRFNPSLGSAPALVVGTAPPAAASAASDVETTDAKQIASVEGFDLDKFLNGFGLGMRPSGVGGPYVALGNVKTDPKAEEEARKVLSTLPLTAPLDHFQLESRFGVREDPFNGHKALHSGLDLSAPYRTPIYATAPGVVVFAGYAAAYGKLVEIDHGNGIHTKYAHMNRIMVNVGQKLTKKTEIGLLGSSGRSTGPHVHYEVVVNGVPQDPEKFLQAGEKMLQGGRSPVTLVKASTK
ncbi:MAG TPA: peptidoglycan DD-metalloendopeptidase family protein [Aliidongia sp.]|nr:peptidoglycan DD-metalloendopeptidase family protein [Aliidongia sp.]